MAAPSSPIPITLVDKQQFPQWLEANPSHRDWLKGLGFTAEPGSIAFLPAPHGGIARVLAAPNDAEPIWQLAHLPKALPEGSYTLDTELDSDAATNAALGWELGSYRFTAYKTTTRQLATIVPPKNADMALVQQLRDATYLARDLINTPAEDMGPEQIAKAAEAIADEFGARIRVIRGDALLSENYPTIHAVGRAASRQPVLVDFEWGNPDAPKVTLVGKGVCFDSGGLDIKPAAGMLMMKVDMGGAAIVLGLAKALMAAQLPIRLRVMIPAVENAIAGNAIRPGDIIRTRSGKTVQIDNTDAEGRLILCDPLWEAASENPELLLDCATLTGAARVALGIEVQALFCDDDTVANTLQEKSLSLGDPFWRLPIWRPYRKQLEGKLSDLSNVSGSTNGGAIYAAVYLAEFTAAAKTWVHLDVRAHNEKERPGRPEGGEAPGLRTMYQYIRERFPRKS